MQWSRALSLVCEKWPQVDEVRPKRMISSDVDEDSDRARAANEARRYIDEIRPEGMISYKPSEDGF